MTRWLIAVIILLTSCVSTRDTLAIYTRGEVIKYSPTSPLYKRVPQGKEYYVRFFTVGGWDTARVWTNEIWKEHQIVRLQ